MHEGVLDLEEDVLPGRRQIFAGSSQAGQGFSPEQLKRLLSANHAEVDSNGSQQDGFRIAFAIGREIVSAHGGDVGVESPGTDQGTTFRVRIPIVKG